MKIIIEHDDGRKVQVPEARGIIMGFLRPDGSTGVVVEGNVKVGEILTMLYGVQTFTLSSALLAIGVQVGTVTQRQEIKGGAEAPAPQDGDEPHGKDN